MLPRPSAILLDWDGLMVDSLLQIHHSHNNVLRFMNLPEVDFPTSIRMTAHGPKALKVVLGYSEDTMETFMGHFRKDYFKFSPDFQMMPGAHEFYESIPAHVPLGIVSSKEGAMLRAEVAHLGWQERISVIVAVNEAPANKPSPVPAHFALEKMDVPPGKNVWFLGDSAGDITCANAAGLTSVLVTTHDYDGPTPDFCFESLHDVRAVATVLPVPA